MATRAASGKVLAALADAVPELWGGSADLAGSNNTTMKGVDSFIPEERSSHDFTGRPGGRTLHFGIREHAMGNIINGINDGRGSPAAYGGTFLVFSDYMRTHAAPGRAVQGAHDLRLDARLDRRRRGRPHPPAGRARDEPAPHAGPQRRPPGRRQRDRARVGADPAHQGPPVRAHPVAPEHDHLRPLRGLRLRRGVRCGQGRLRPEGGLGGEPEVILVGTGSELEIAVKAAELLEAEGVPARVVSLPCVEWFKAQDEAYQAEVLPTDVPKVVIEAGTPVGWKDLLGANTEAVGIDHYGASADAKTLYEEFGITAEAVGREGEGPARLSPARPLLPRGGLRPSPSQLGIVHPAFASAGVQRPFRGRRAVPWPAASQVTTA